MLLIFFSWMRMYGSSSTRFHPVRIGDEVRAEIAAVELHALDGLELGAHRLGLFDGDDAVLADLLHRFRDDVADGGIAVRGNRADLGDHVAADRLGELLNLGDNRFHSLLDAALQRHRVCARGNSLHAFAEDRLSQDRRGRGAVTGDVAGLRRDFAHHLRAHVLERILQLDFFRDRDAVLGDRRAAELLLEHDVAALGTEGYLHSVGELIHTAQDRLAGIFAIDNLFCSHISLIPLSD